MIKIYINDSVKFKNKDITEQFKFLVENLYGYVKERLNFKEDVEEVVIKSKDGGKGINSILEDTGGYNIYTKSIELYIGGRHPKDILRSFSHELVHHWQNLNGDFENISFSKLSNNYAQTNLKLREAEKQAFLEGNMMFRDWEDSLKNKKLYEEFNRKKINNKLKMLKDLEELRKVIKNDTGEESMHFDFLFKEIFGMLFENHGFRMLSFESNFAYEYGSEGIEITIFPVGLTPEEDDVVIKILSNEMKRDNKKINQNIHGNSFDDIVKAYEYIVDLFN